MSFTSVGYSLATDFAKRLFAQIQTDSGVLASLKKAVLDSANGFAATLGTGLTEGAKWTHPQTGVKYNVPYRVLNSTAVTITDIQPR